MPALNVCAGRARGPHARFLSAVARRRGIILAAAWLAATVGTGCDVLGQPPPARPATAHRAQAAEASVEADTSREPPDENLWSLLRDILPEGRPARPPYLPARYDLALRDELAAQRKAAQRAAAARPGSGPASSSVADDPFGAPPAAPSDPFGPTSPAARAAQPPAPTNLEELAAAAAARQERLERLWADLQGQGVGPSPSGQAAVALLDYAFGRRDLAETAPVVRRAGPAAQLLLARLLLAECRFEDAVVELAAVARPLAAPHDEFDALADAAHEETARRALALLVAHQAERAALGRRVDLVPLRFDLDGFLKQMEADPKTKTLIDALRRTAWPHLSADDPVLYEELETVESLVEFEIGDFVSPLDRGADDPPIVELPAGRPAPGGRWPTLIDVERCALVAANRELVLYQPPRWNTGVDAELTLYTAFHGPMRFRLYRFVDQDAWERIDAAGLSALEPHREWTQEFRPLRENNVRPPEEHAIRLEGLDEAWYLLTVEARYAPMLGACKFAVNDVALYLHAGRNRGVAVAVDRRTGLPVPQMPLEVTIAGAPDFARVLRQSAPKDGRLFAQGFYGRTLDAATAETEAPGQALSGGERHPVGASAAATALSPEEHLRRAAAYREGVEARERYLDHEEVRRLSTGADGSASFPLDLGREDYRYRVAAARAAGPGGAGGASRVEVAYQERPAGADWLKAVVWLAQPIHRPGDTARFQGIVRRFDGRRVADHDPASLETLHIRVVNRDGEVWSGTCEVSAAGTFAGEFLIPADVPLGPCRFEVNRNSASPSQPLVVAEFRLPTYEIALDCPKRPHAGGEELCGTAEVRYFSGKPAVGAAVEVVVEGDGIEPVARIAQTDENGRAEFRLPLPLLEQSRRLPVRVTVADAAGQTYTAGAQVDCRASEFEVGVSARPTESSAEPNDASVIHHGAAIEVVVTARRWSGEPLAGATVAVDGCHESATTDEHGAAVVRMKAAAQGSRQSLAVTAIADGKVVRYTAFSIALQPRPKLAEAEPSDPKPPDPAPPVARRSPPQPLSVQFTGERPGVIDAGGSLDCVVGVAGDAQGQATLVLVAENDRLLHAETRAVGPGEHRFTIATRPDWAPSVRLTAVLLDGQRAKRAALDVFLRPTERFLTLVIETDRDEYPPGGECSAVVTALDYQGQPVPRAAVSLGVVDEALYEVYEDPTPDLRDFFYQYRLPCLCVHGYDTAPPSAQSLSFWLGPRYAWGSLPIEMRVGGRHALLGRYGGSAASVRGGSARVRTRFETTAHWVADLVTDGEGRARTTFRLPDSLTRWRFTARGVTPDTKVGQVRLQRRTFLPLQVELALPRVVRVGDRVELPVALHNHADRPRSVELRTRIGEGRERTSRLALGAKADLATFLPLDARGTAPVTLFASARDARSGDADAIEKTIAPRPKGFRYERSFSGSLGELATLAIDPGVKFPAEGLKLTIRREPGLVGVIRSAVGELIDFPYGCVEQTMSRFMPAVLAAEALRAAGVDDPAANRLPEVVAQGLAKLEGYQHADGGWGWWQYDATNDFMTAYVVEGLALCRASGHDVPDRMLDRGQAHLLGRLVEDRLAGHRPHSIAEVALPVYAARAVAMVYRHEPARYAQAMRQTAGVLERIEREGGRRSALDDVVLADAWRLVGRTDLAATMLPKLQGRVAFSRHDRRATVYAAQLVALGAALEPDQRQWERLAAQLAGVRGGSGWGDTLTSAYAVRALAAVVRSARDGDVPVTVLVDNKPLGLLPRTDEGGGFEMTLHKPAQVRLNPKSRGGDDFFHARLEGYLEEWPANPPEPAVEVSLRVFRAGPPREAIEPDAAGRIALPRGVTLELLVEVRLDEPVEHARLTLPRPCGFELVRTARPGNGLAAVEERDEAWHFFIDRWDRGRQELSFLVRAELAGEVGAPPPELVPMYDDSRPTAVLAPRRWLVEAER